MTKFFTMMGVSVFLLFSGVSALAEQTSDKSQDGMKSQESMQDDGSRESSINTTPKESERQKAARPGEAGEEGETSIFGSPSTLPPNENSPGYTGADKELEKREQQQKGM